MKGGIFLLADDTGANSKKYFKKKQNKKTHILQQKHHTNFSSTGASADKKVQVLVTASLRCWRACEDDFLSLLFCSHTGCSCHPHNRGTAQCNEQDYQGRLAGIVWYQRESSQWGIFRQHSRSFIHCLRTQSDSAHSPAVKPCHYPLVCFCLAGDRPLLLLACVSRCIHACVYVCMLYEQVHVYVAYVCVFSSYSLCTHLRLVIAP